MITLNKTGPFPPPTGHRRPPNAMSAHPDDDTDATDGTYADEHGAPDAEAHTDAPGTDADGYTDLTDGPGAVVPADAGSGPPARHAHATNRSRCAELRLESGDLVIYHGGSRDAWLQSSVAVDIGRLR